MGPPAADKCPLAEGLPAKRAPDIQDNYSEGQRASSASCWLMNPEQPLRHRGSDTRVWTRVCMLMCVSVQLAPCVEVGDFQDQLGPERVWEAAL